jgi:NAD(P)H-hydrate epimerase
MFWHGAAADMCAEEIGPIGFRASDVAMTLPRARAKIVSACIDR